MVYAASGHGIAFRRAMLYILAMQFTLTAQMIDKIGFAMEDQKEQFAVDAETGELVPLSTTADDPERYVQLPRWGSAEGFHLMESFVTSLENPVYREQLTHALTTGKGVFRTFKDVLKQSKEIEKLWFLYKERKLKGVIISWYNTMREARGLERLPAEPEETEELVASDFSFAWGVSGMEREILQLDRDAFCEQFPNDPPSQLDERYGEKRRGIPAIGEEASPVLTAVTPDGELAGFAWGVISGKSVHIVQLAVSPALRGIGLGESLLRQFLTAMRGRGMERLTTELMGKSLRYVDFFGSMGFAVVTQLMECSLGQLPY
jgi:ribosomal protein S18 acetylase RimI-like enzyme